MERREVPHSSEEEDRAISKKSEAIAPEVADLTQRADVENDPLTHRWIDVKVDDNEQIAARDAADGSATAFIIDFSVHPTPARAIEAADMKDEQSIRRCRVLIVIGCRKRVPQNGHIPAHERPIDVRRARGSECVVEPILDENRPER